MGNLKKLENVCASKTSLVETAINNPKKVDVTAISTTLINVDNQFISKRSTTNEAKNRGIKALMIPKRIDPVVLASINRFRLMGANSNLSKDLLFLSKVIVTESMDVVPNKTDKAITPGSIPRISTLLVDLIKNISVQDIGKIIPQQYLVALSNSFSYLLQVYSSKLKFSSFLVTLLFLL
jgi:hypothetical protein